MIISPPFLPANNNLAEDAWIDSAMPLDLPTGAAPRGVFPVGQNLGWHGGLHLVAPPDGAGVLPVRAIADGTVVYVRQPAPVTTVATEPLNYDPAMVGASRTDDGCVVIRHETEVGATGAGVATSVTFYSIYMHLATVTCANQVVAGVAQQRATPFLIQRKDQIGTAGQIYGQPNRIHFEIIFDDAALQSILGRTLTQPAAGADGTAAAHTLDLAATSDGRSDAVFGEIYFRLPVGTTFYAARPALNVTAPTAAATHTLTEEQIVGMKFAAGDGPQANRGDISYRTYQLDGTEIGAAIIETDGEYNLYTTANDISRAYPATGRPAPSAVYELLRFGRILDTVNETLTPADVPMWKDVNYAGGHGWVNLHATGIHVYSDADLPQWKGWQVVDSDTDADSRCDAARIRAILDQDGDGTITPAEATTRIGDADIRKKLSRFLCKMPTEWEAASIDTRWGWLKTSNPENPTPFDDTRDYQPFKAHVTALCFWQAANLGIPATHWHAHPIEFIRHFRKCGWLDRTTLVRIYPGTDGVILERYRDSLNRVLRRYGLKDAKRGSHFFGQGAVETIGLRCMVEGSVSFARNPNHASYQPEDNGYYSDPRDLYGFFHRYERTGNDLGNMLQSDLRNSRNQRLPVVLGAGSPPVVQSPTAAEVDSNLSRTGDGMKFRGRGFKQLTGLFNYSEYWVYRGWLSRSNFDANWWDPQHPNRRAPQIDNPQIISTVPFNCIDSGGQFAARNRIARPADRGVTRADADAVSQIVNRWDAPSFERRFNGATRAYEVLGP